MTQTGESSGRRSARLSGAFAVDFSINGAPSRRGETVNLNDRSMAIRTDARVAKGDTIRAQVAHLPPVDGKVVRVWDEGFAVELDTPSLAMSVFTHRRRSQSDARDAASPARRIESPLIRIEAAEPTWCRIASVSNGAEGVAQHLFSFVTTVLPGPEPVKSVWLASDHARWIARRARCYVARGKHVIAATINPWQMEVATAHGLSVTVVLREFDEWSAYVPPESIQQHWARFAAGEGHSPLAAIA